MGRLTEKENDYYMQSEDCESIFDLTEKLGQLEDIEQELGIDLITLFKALKDKPYLKDKMEDGTTFISKGAVHLEKAFFENNLTLCCGYKEPSYYRLKDYGKTWALTKEELEK